MLSIKYFICFILLSLYVNVFGSIHADFTADNFSGCSPLLSNFTNTSTTSTEITEYYWDFGNGNTSTLQNPSAIFNISGTYRVKLIVGNGIERDSIGKSVVVYRLPQVNFAALNTVVCDHDTLVLNSHIILGSAPIIDYAWGLGNGIASSGADINYIYPQTGDYDITLIVQDSNHCSANLTKPGYIHVAPKPHAAFTASPQYSCNSSQLVNFTNNSTGTGLSYLWKLTDSTTSSLQNPSHLYSQLFYWSSLTVTNSDGCTDYTRLRVGSADIIADFSSNKQQVCTGQPVNFNNTSNFQAGSLWNFGDGNTNRDNSPTHVYNLPGVYTVKLIQQMNSCVDSITKTAYINVTQGFTPTVSVTDPVGGCNDTSIINFTASGPNGSQYAWGFGDGTTSTLQNVSHNFVDNGNYTIVVVVTDSNGCSVPISVPITINKHKPNPWFSADRIGCPNTPLSFHDASGAISTFTYFWSFGDGDTSTLKNPVHNYQNPGTYSISLKVTNGLGCDSTIYRPDFISIEDIHADFNVNRRFSPCPPFVTLFTSNTNKPVRSYSWDFGDGAIDTAANPTHIYFHPGIFTVKLAVITASGCADTVVYTNLIEVQGPTAQFSITPSSGCLPLNSFITVRPTSNTKTISADLGDGTLVIDSLDFNHTYTQLGTFSPKFILQDYVGCTVPYDLPPVVTHSPPVLHLHDTTICEGQTVSVALGNDNYRWSGSTNLSCDTCANVTIMPSATAVYTVNATNQYACVVTDTMKVTVVPLPVLTSTSFKICKNSSLELKVGDAYRMSWSPSAYLSDSSVVLPICTPLDSITYTATGYNSLGCSTTAQATIKVLDKLDVSANDDITICAFDTFSLQAAVADEPDAGVNYNWSPANYLSDATIAAPAGNKLGSETTFSVIVSAQTCTPDTALLTVHIRALPDIHISDPVTTTPYAEVNMWANSHQQLSYVWSAPDSFSCINCRQTSFYPSQTQTVYVTGTNDFGCHTTDSVQIKVVPCDPESVFLPNIFTPNGDGLNDVLFLNSKALATLNYFRIFDEWGNMVYETKNINDAWDGKVKGAPAAIDAFVYVLEGKCQNGGDVLKYGNVTLVR